MKERKTRNNYKFLYERRHGYMSKIKSMIIYILSVALAFESGLIAIFVCVMAVLADEKTESKKRSGRVSYSSYYNERRGA
ncbi:hypothetical protein [uncultured Phocaeicola sp.]|uniref:hypothetical protein n=1 Tax=uncultured Phocaeicola sp. TaxID=990718 RepID=UPI00260732C9|nr:hypothetical protein [uncultured Phocaeicola sp.]